MNYFDKIAISGKMASGKTTVSNFLIDNLDYAPIRSAEYLKYICSDLANLNMYETYAPDQGILNVLRRNLDYHIHFIAKDQQEEELLKVELEKLRKQFSHVKVANGNNKTDDVRQMLQVVANVILTNVRQDIWVSSSIKVMDGLNSKGNNKIVHDDLRYQFEFDKLREAGFVMIRLNVSEEVQAKRVKTLYGKIEPERLTHISETDLDFSDFDYTINADQPLIDMLDEIKSIITR